jgi:hypothetical protein
MLAAAFRRDHHAMCSGPIPVRRPCKDAAHIAAPQHKHTCCRHDNSLPKYARGRRLSAQALTAVRRTSVDRRVLATQCRSTNTPAAVSGARRYGVYPSD